MVREILASLDIPYEGDPLQIYKIRFYYQEGVVCELSEANNFWSWHWQDVVQSGLLAEFQTPTSEVNHKFAIIPHVIQKYFVTLLVGSFLNVILNLSERETSKCRLSMAALLNTHKQLHNTINHCSDMCPTIINRPKAWTWKAPEERQVSSWWMSSAVPIESPSQTSTLFYVSLTTQKKPVFSAEALHNLTISSILIQKYFLFLLLIIGISCAYLGMIAWWLISLHFKFLYDPIKW